MAEFEHRQVQANGIALHCAIAGPAGAPLIVFLHGFPEFWYAWRAQLRALSDRFLCVACDTRGINLSDKPAARADYDIAALVEDVRQLIAALGHDTAVVVGHDWGGFIAWELAIRHPEVVRRLIIANCAHPDAYKRLIIDSPAQQAASQYTLAFRSERGEALLSHDDFAGFRANILAPGVAAGHLDDADVAAYLAAWRQPGALTAGLNYYRANRLGPAAGGEGPPPAPRRGDAARVTPPTLVMWGEKDPYFSTENIDLLNEYVSNLTLHRFPDNDHWIVHQIPDEVSRLIGDFAA